MQVPVQLQFKDMEADSRIEERIHRKAEHLDRLCDNLTSCRVLVARPHEHARSGSPWKVRIELAVPPNHDIVVTKKPGDHDLHDSLETVVNNAFDAAERQLKETVERRRRRRGTPKTPAEPWALVVRLNPEEDFGFLKTPTGRDIYFHRNSVLGDDFDRLEIGTGVRFEETMGDEGPQATTVQILDKPGSTVDEDEESPPEPVEPPRGW